MKLSITLNSVEDIAQVINALSELFNQMSFPIELEMSAERVLASKLNVGLPPPGKYVRVDNKIGIVVKVTDTYFTVKFSKSEVTFPKGYLWSFINEFEQKVIVWDGTFEKAKGIMRVFSDNIEYLNTNFEGNHIICGSFRTTTYDDSYFNFYYRNNLINKGDKICWWEHIVTGEKIKIHIEECNE